MKRKLTSNIFNTCKLLNNRIILSVKRESCEVYRTTKSSEIKGELFESMK